MDAAHAMVERLIEREGGFVDHPSDPGGPTKYGITMFTLEVWRGSRVTRDDVSNLSRGEAHKIYHSLYLDRFAAIKNELLQELLFDTSVNFGVKRTTLMAQDAVGVPVDGMLGPITIGALNRNPVESYTEVLRRRLARRDEVIQRNPVLEVFRRGWANRDQFFVDKLEAVTNGG